MNVYTATGGPNKVLNIRSFLVSGSQYSALMRILERREQARILRVLKHDIFARGGRVGQGTIGDDSTTFIVIYCAA